ncbi:MULTISPECIES: hypothetical protein [Aeromonas]|uniref:hypothetical protein n=1 Tax=Aeromonas TaxID=642 RepID=UPI0013025203|nr:MULTISPECIES: hypothetical protein [Aeromonas]KAE9622474.1 hypothetical protein GO627_21230 [Aeromonas veronii]
MLLIDERHTQTSKNEVSAIFSLAKEVVGGALFTDHRIINKVIENIGKSNAYINDVNVADIITDMNIRNATTQRLFSSKKTIQNKIDTLYKRLAKRAIDGRNQGGTAGALNRDMNRIHDSISIQLSRLSKINNELTSRSEA